MRIKNYARTVSAAILSGLMVFGAAGCGAATPAASAATTPASAAPTEAPAPTEVPTAAPAPVETPPASAAPETPEASTEPIKIVWYPNESANDYAPSRDEFARLITEATGRPAENILTTDYVIAIESLASGAADIGAVMGAVGYIEAKERNPEVDLLIVNSGDSGTLDDAIYYSWLAVNRGEEGNYADGGSYGIENIKGKKMSFVSNSSTSGFVVPTTGIKEHFGVTEDDLIEGGPFFSEVLFGGSHQGSAVNLLAGQADVAAFCDTEMTPYMDVTEGDPNKIGSVYTVKADASAPFDVHAGKEVFIINSTPVLNGPTAINPAGFTQEEIESIRELLTSDEVAKNELIFAPEDSDGTAFYSQPQRYVRVEDSWYNPIRDMGN